MVKICHIFDGMVTDLEELTASLCSLSVYNLSEREVCEEENTFCILISGLWLGGTVAGTMFVFYFWKEQIL